MGKRGRPHGSKDSRQRNRSKKTTAAKIQLRSNVQPVSALASEIASRSAFIASMRTTESASIAAGTTLDNDGASESEDEVTFGSFGPIKDVDNLELLMNQQEFRPEDIEAELDNNNEVEIVDSKNGIMAIFLKAVHQQLREEVRGRAAKRAMATDNAESSWRRLVDTRWAGTTCLQEAWSFLWRAILLQGYPCLVA
jgi:hypothetical protein